MSKTKIEYGDTGPTLSKLTVRNCTDVWKHQDQSVHEALINLVSIGAPVVPVWNEENSQHKAKQPVAPWKDYQVVPPTKENAEYWIKKYGDYFGIALVTGPASGWVVIDADSEQAEAWIKENFPFTPLIQRTRNGCHFFYRQGTRAIPTKTGLGSDSRVDTRGAGGLIIIAPSSIEGAERKFEFPEGLESPDVPTLDALEGFDDLFRVTTSQFSHGTGGNSEVVRDMDSGLVIDGRESYLRDIIYAKGLELHETNGGHEFPLTDLATSAWEIFSKGADLSDDKWGYHHAVTKASYLLKRLRNGEINPPGGISVAPPKPGDDEPLLSPQEASDCLKSYLEEFLQKRGLNVSPEFPEVWLIRSPAGLGKTTSTVALCADYVFEREKLDVIKEVCNLTFDDPYPDLQPSFMFFVKTHNLGRELENTITKKYEVCGLLPSVVRRRGRTEGIDDGLEPCVHAKAAKKLGSRGYSVGATLCQSWDFLSGRKDQCQHFNLCEYVSTRREFSDFVILVHQELEYPHLPSFKLDFVEPLPPGETGFYRPNQNGTTYIIDESPLDSLVVNESYPLGALEQIKNKDLRKAIRSGLCGTGRLLDVLRESGFDSKQLGKEAKDQDRCEGFVPSNALPGQSESAINKWLPTLGKKYRWGEPLSRLAVELATGRSGNAHSLEYNSETTGNEISVRGRRATPLPEMPGMFLDATAEPELLRPFYPNLVVKPEIQVERNAFVTQISSNTFSKYALFDGKRCDEFREEVRSYVQEVAANNLGGKTLVVTYQKLRREWTGETEDKLHAFGTIPGTSVDVAHFGNIRGLDRFKDHVAIVIVGRQESPEGAESRAKGIWYDDYDPIQSKGTDRLPRRHGYYRLRNLGLKQTTGNGVSYHPDQRAQWVMEQIREKESLQSLDRLRLIHNKEIKSAHILCDIPLPGVVVDRLVSWEEEMLGGTKLERALERCDDQQLDALLLTPAWLSEKLPDLWPKEKSAENWWNGGNPLTSNRYYGDWWGLVEYSLTGKGGKPRKALVRNGVNLDTALAAAIGEPPIKVTKLSYPGNAQDEIQQAEPTDCVRH